MRVDRSVLNELASDQELAIDDYLRQAGMLVTRTLPGGTEVELVHKAWSVGTYSKAKREVVIVASDETVDRYGDVIEAAGWDLDPYRRNPVVLIDHRYNVASIAGKADVRVEGRKLKARLVMDDPEKNEAASLVLDRLDSGVLRAVSVGFQPREREYIKDKSDRVTGIRFKKSELLEISWVAVPANPNATLSLSDAEDEAKMPHDIATLSLVAQLTGVAAMR